MIIFGTRGVKSTIKSGDFNCPQCEKSVPYRHRKVTKFFTLYFIPLIPLGSAGEYVECGTCKGTFIPRVLESSPNDLNQIDFMAIYEQAIRHSMVLMMLADGVIDSEEKTLVRTIINKFGKNDLSIYELEKYIEQVQNEREDITTYLSKVGPSLNEHGKETIIKCALSVAAADGHVDETEIALIGKMGEVMEMSSSHLKGIIAEMSEEKELA